MTIRDYISKHATAARRNGIKTAAYSATTEAALKATAPLARTKATPIWAGEWDVCLVLDACRYDLWREVALECDWLGDGSAWSVGSASPEWLNETFAPVHGEEIRRAGYVTANPFSAKNGHEVGCMADGRFPLADRELAYFDEVWRDEWATDGELPTVAPADVTDRAFAAWQERERHGMDRLVVHYMQPHVPFRSRPEWCEGWDVEGFGAGGGRSEKDDWHRVRDGEIDAREFWDAYADNLRWVVAEVERWRKCTDARILVTSDHGNAMGEWGQWSHPPESANPVLRKVPWTLVEGQAEEPITSAKTPPSSVGGGSVSDRLSSLGYLQ